MSVKAAPMTRSSGGWLAGEPLLLIGVIIVALYFARTLLIPLAFAIVFNFLLAPAVELLERVHVRRGFAILLVILVFFSGVATVGWIVARQVVHVVETLPDYRGNIEAKLNQLHTPMAGAAGRAVNSLEELAVEFSSGSNPAAAAAQENLAERSLASRRHASKRLSASQEAAALQPDKPTQVEVVQPPVTAGAYLRDMTLPILRPFGIAAIVLVFTIYILIHREELRNRLLLLAGIGHLNMMTQALNEAAERISRYLVMQFLVNGCFGLLYGVGLFALGVPDATLWGAIAALLRIVPYAGTIVVGALPLIFSLAISTGWKQPMGVLGIFLSLEIMTAYVIEPWLYGSKTGVGSLALLASAIFWSTLWGWPGLVLSTPLTVCLIVMGRYVPQMRFLHVLLGDDAELAPEAQFYERLLAMDQIEVRQIADRYIENRPLVDLYDNILLPSLSMAKQDHQKGELDDARGNFLQMSVAELLAEYSEYKNPADSAPTIPPAAGVDGFCRRFPVVCIAASDNSDELSATMLAQLLEQGGFNTILLPISAVTPEILSRLAQDKSTVVCIAALPPFAFSAARAACLRVREQMPKNRVLVGLWRSTQEQDQLPARFGVAQPTALVSTLREAVEQVSAWDEYPGQRQTSGSTTGYIPLETSTIAE
jgi:predicted PurR-regulated permease PerM